MNIDLPRNWCKTTIGEVFIVTLGQSPPSSTYNSQGKGLPFFQGKAEFGDIYPIARKWCSSPKKIAQRGDVLLSVRAPVGPTNIAPTKCCIGRGLASIHPVGGIDTKFILYFFRSVERYLALIGAGTTFNAITGDKLKDFPIALPPLPEQHHIIAKIEELFTRLDAGLESLNQIQGYDTKPIKGKALQLRQSILKRAFEGKLVPQDPNDEPASVLLEKINAQKAKSNKAKQLEMF